MCTNKRARGSARFPTAGSTSPTGRLIDLDRLPPMQNLPHPKTETGNAIRTLLKEMYGNHTTNDS